MLESIEAAWLEARYDDLTQWFHQDSILVAPGFGARLRGREACIDSYREFGHASRIHSFSADARRIDLWGDTAVIETRFAISYEIEGERTEESGVDLLVLIEEQGRWLVIWRTLFSEEGGASDRRSPETSATSA